MGDDTEVSMKTWKEVFNQISYCYEDRYDVSYWEQDGIEYVSVYKGTFSSDGNFNYKTSNESFDPALWPKIKLFAKLFEENGVLDVLYGNNNSPQD